MNTDTFDRVNSHFLNIAKVCDRPREKVPYSSVCAVTPVSHRQCSGVAAA